MENYNYIQPAHYKGEDGKDLIDEIMETEGIEAVRIFCYWTAKKYDRRVGKKPGEPAARDVAKAREYIDRYKRELAKHNGALT
jgi:hypothetical protein